MTQPGSGAAVAALALAVSAVVALHLLQAELAPMSHRLSEYAAGEHGWLMTVAFFAAAGAVFLLARGEWDVDRAVAVLLVTAGVGLLLSGVFPSGVSPQSEQWHGPVSTAATVGVVVAAVAGALGSLRQRRRGARVDAALACCAAALLVVSPLLHDTAWCGLGQRLLWAVLAAWLARRAWRGWLPGNAPDRRDVSPVRRRKRSRHGRQRGIGADLGARGRGRRAARASDW